MKTLLIGPAGRFKSGAAAAVILTTTAAWAHHGWSSYDAEKVLTIEAPLTVVEYRNPHAQVQVDRDGRPWVVVLAPTGRMESRGLKPDALVVGKVVTIEGYPRKDGTAEIRAERITVDGTAVELR